MRIKLEQSGGIGGFTRTVEINSTELTAREAGRLKTMVNKSQLLTLPVQEEAQGRDSTKYTITVENDIDSRNIVMSGRNVPDSLIPLIRFLLGKGSSSSRSYLAR